MKDKEIMKEDEIFYAYEMIYDKTEVPESNIECIGFDKTYIKEYMASYNAAFYPMRKALDIEPFNWYSEESAVLEKADDTYLLIKDGNLIGAVACYGNEIDDLFVKASEQGKGYGRELLLWGMNHIREKNDEPITLHVAAWNQGACSLYQSIGFVVRNKEKIK